MSELNQRKILINAIIGKGVASIEDCVVLEKAGYMRFTGNQHNPNWDWSRTALQDLTWEQLQQVYESPTSLVSDE